MPTNLTQILTKQHNELRAIVARMNKNTLENQESIQSILKDQDEFKKVLENHLDLENKTFYPDLIRLLESKKMSTEKIEDTKKFIAEMKDIEIDVYKFLSEYSSTENIESKKENYKHDLNNMVQALAVRVETEEEGVYTIWEALSHQTIQA